MKLTKRNDIPHNFYNFSVILVISNQSRLPRQFSGIATLPNWWSETKVFQKPLLIFQCARHFGTTCAFSVVLRGFP